MPLFPELVATLGPQEQLEPIRPGFKNPDMDTDQALRIILHETSSRAGETIRTGTAQCPRTAYLRLPAPTERSVLAKGIGKSSSRKRKPRSAAPICSRLVMHCDNEHRLTPRAHGKHSAMWIGRHDTVMKLREQSRGEGEVDLLGKGVVRFITSVHPSGKQVSVQPPITKLCNVDGEWEEVRSVEGSRDDALLVVTLLLSDLHEEYFAYESFRHESCPCKHQGCCQPLV